MRYVIHVGDSHLMTQVISFINLVTGGGKTTTGINLASALKRRGHMVLVVDLAPEETISQRVRFANPRRTLLGTKVSPRADAPAKIVVTMEGWHLMPAAASGPLLHARTLYHLSHNHGFHDELNALFEPYDYVLVDGTHRELALLMQVLAVTDEVVVPLDSESLQFHDTVERLAGLFAGRGDINPNLKFGGVFLSHYAPRFRRAREMLTALFDALGPVNCFSAYLADSDAIRQAEQRRVSVLTGAPTSQAAHAFYQLAEQLTNAAVPRIQTPTLLVTPGRAFVNEAAAAEAERYEPAAAFVTDDLPTWKERSENAVDLNQALRYAVFALMEDPHSAAVLELFEDRLTRLATDAAYMDVKGLIELGEFLAYHSLDHYAAQLLRRATELNPAHLRAWADLARLSELETERAYALAQCLGLDQGMAAAEAPELPRRVTRNDVPAFASHFGSMLGAKA